MVKQINGTTYSTFDELFFAVRNSEPGSINTYLIERDGKQQEIEIITDRIGSENVLRRCGPVFLWAWFTF